MQESDVFVKALVFPSLLLVVVGAIFFMTKGGEDDEEMAVDGDAVVLEQLEQPEEPEFEVWEYEEAEPRVKVAPRPAEEAPAPSRVITSDWFDEFVERFEKHYEENPRKLLHVTVDRPMYRPGQTVQWRSWHRQAATLGLGSGDEAKIQWVSPQGDVVEEREVAIEMGRTFGEIAIDDDARGGQWKLKISDGDEEYERPVLVSHFEPPRFRQDLDFDERAFRPGDTVRAQIEVHRDTGEPLRGRTITGYLQVSGRHVADIEERLDGAGRARIEVELPGRISSDDAALVLTIEEGGMVETEVFPVPLALEDILVEFRPEGGELVQGLPSRVYFEAADLKGMPVELEGVVVDDRGQLVAEIDTVHRGRGRFEFTPRPGRSYELEVTRPTSVEQGFSLPSASRSGCVLRVYDDLDAQVEEVRAGVWCTDEKMIGAAAFMGDKVVAAGQSIAGPEEPAVFYLAPEDGGWPRAAGMVRVTVVDPSNVFRPVAERLVFRGRRAQLGIEVEADKEVYHPGETVELSIRVEGLEGEPLLAEIAKGVVDDRVHARAHYEIPTILAQLVLRSDNLHFWGDVDEADEYFDLYEERAAQGLDLLVGVRGWRSGDERGAFFVDGGKEKIERFVPPPPPRRPRGRPIRAARGQAQVEMLGAGGMADGMGRAGAAGGARGAAPADAPTRARREAPAMVESAPAPAQVLEEVAQEQEESEGGAAGASAPWWARDDDAAAFVAWEPSLRTGSDGRVGASFVLPEAIGAYRVKLEGIADGGLVGFADLLIPVEVPLSVAIRMPEIFSGGDHLLVPLTVRNTTDEVMDAVVQLTGQGPISIDEARASFEVRIPPRTTATEYVAVRVLDSREGGALQAMVQGGGFTDGAQRTFQIEPRGYDQTSLLSGQLPGRVRHSLPLAGMTEVGATGDLVLYPSPIAEALEGVESMSRMPMGCFEQASGSNHPNVLVYAYLKENNRLDGALTLQLERNIEAGYRLLSGYEIPGGGFEWFGRPPAQAALSAWGLVQFTAMKEIVDDFDEGVLDRTMSFLRSLQDADGSWDRGNSAAWQRIAPADRRPAELLVIYGLARVGETQGFEKQLEEAAQIAAETDDLYHLALSTAALAFADHPGASRGMERLLARQEEDGSWKPKGGRGWTWGYGNSFDVETTGVAAQALIAGGASRAPITGAINWLGGKRTRNGWWGSTQATVMAMEARIAYEQQGLDTSSGTVRVLVDGEEVGRTRVDGDDVKPARIINLGQYLTEDSGELVVQSEVGVDYDLELSWRVEAFDINGESPLDVHLEIGDGSTVRMGDEVSMRLEVTNRESNRLGMVIARVALPAGVEVTDRELDALVQRSAVDLYETTGRDIILYFEDMEGDEHHALRFSGTAAVPGQFEVPAYVAYPYYRDETHWKWGESSTFFVSTP